MLLLVDVPNSDSDQEGANEKSNHQNNYSTTSFVCMIFLIACINYFFSSIECFLWVMKLVVTLKTIAYRCLYFLAVVIPEAGFDVVVV